MHTAYTFDVQHIYYIWSLPMSEETKSVALKGNQTNTLQKRKLQIQLFFVLTASSKYADDFLPSEYVLDICCDGKWMNISRSQAVVLLLIALPNNVQWNLILPVSVTSRLGCLRLPVIANSPLNSM